MKALTTTTNRRRGIGNLWKPQARPGVGDLFPITTMPRPYDPFQRMGNGVGDLLSQPQGVPVGTQIQGFGCACNAGGMGAFDIAAAWPEWKTAAVAAVAGMVAGAYLRKKF